MSALRAPFPWFGGKSRAASLIWEALGDVRCYVEPFAGSLAALLARETEPGIETVNDVDAYLANFWRALAADPDAVARAADWPVNEADLHARHAWLVGQVAFRERVIADPDFYDAKIAGWWVWGLSCWIGGGWCTAAEAGWRKRPKLLDAGTGVHRTERTERRRPRVTAAGSAAGVHRTGYRLPNVDGFGARGTHRHDLEDGGLVAEFRALADRLRRVRVCCGDWTRVLTPSVLRGNGVTGVLLDPPYDLAERASGIYAHDGAGVSAAVRAWAIEHGNDPDLRIVLCGYEGEHAMPAGWRAREWKATGGYGRGRGAENRHRERLWLSPGCLTGQARMFDGAGATS